MGVVKSEKTSKKDSDVVNFHKESMSLMSDTDDYDDEIEDDGEELNFEANELTEEEYLEQVPVQSKAQIERDLKGYNFDLFTDVGDRRAEMDDVVIYEIFKNNQMLTTKTHPYSWKELQEEFDGGTYKVTAKSGVNKRYIKTQTRSVSATPTKTTSNVASDNSKNFLEVFQSMNSQIQENQKIADEKAREERRLNEERIFRMQEEQKKLQVESQNNMTSLLGNLLNKPKDNSMETMVSMMNNQSQQNMQMMVAMMEANKPVQKDDSSKDLMMLMMEMQKTNIAMMDKMNESTSRQIEKITEKFEQSKSSDDMSGMKLVELYTGAMNQGFNQMQMLNDLADAKAEAKGGSDSEDSESMTQTLIKSVAPLLASMASLNQGGGVNLGNNPTPAQPQRVAPPQRNAPQRSNRGNGQAKNNGAQVTKEAQRVNPTNEGGRNVAGQGIKENNVGLPSANPEVEAPRKPRPIKKVEKQVVSEPVETVVAQNTESSIIDTSGKDKAVEVLIPIVGQCMANGNTPQDSAPIAIQYLTQQGIDAKVVVPQFNGEELITIASGFGIKESEYEGVETWLRNFYDSLLENSAQTIG